MSRPLRRRFSFTVAVREYDAIQELAADAHVNPSAYARMALFTGIRALRATIGGGVPAADVPEPPPPDTVFDAPLAAWLNGREEVTFSAAWSGIGRPGHPTYRQSRVLASALVRLGYERCQRRADGGKREYVYRLRVRVAVQEAPSTLTPPPAPVPPRPQRDPSATPSAPVDPSDPVAALVADPAFLPAVRIPALRLAAARVKVSGG